MNTYNIATGWICVLDGGESDKAIFIDVNPEGITGRYQNIDSEVKLVVIDEEGLPKEIKVKVYEYILN